MKKLFILLSVVTLSLASCSDYDDVALWNKSQDIDTRLTTLEELCEQLNTNVSSLQTIVTALQNNDYVTGVTPVMQGGKEVGYTITFSKGNPITIYHGKDGQDGEDGTTPTIGVKQDADGVYYWTLNGEYIVVDGEKIQAEGKNGTNGINGTTPQFKIENDYWFISYDNGTNWTQLGKATGEDGKDGEDGVGGDSMFSGVDYDTSTDYVIFTLADGTQIKLPTWSAFEALQRLCNETNTNLSALQTIVTALQNNDYITSVDPLTENGKVVGYTIKFAKSNPIVIYNGKDGADGVNGNTPIIGVKKDTDGIYYWTLDGEFIVVDEQKIKAQGTDGNNGADGSDGVTPKLEIREGYWWISYDNGANWTQLGKATGEDGKDADSIKITQDENNVYFELADGTVITISKTGQSVDPNIIQFADENVKKLCVGMWDTNGDLELSYDEAATVTSLGTTFTGNSEIQIFNELKHFTGLTVLDDAFSGCSNLWKVTIPVNVESITFNNFKGCVSLKTITFEKGSKLKAFTGGHDNNYKILGAFLDCKSLTTIEIPASVESLGTAFKGSSLRTITFEKGSKLKSITGGYQNKDNYSGALSDCKALTFIEIPASVETIGIAAFKGCSSLEMITFEKGSKLESISGVRDLGAFDGAINLTTVDMSECTQVKRIDEYTFYGNSNLRLFKIGTEIPPTCKDYTFYNINPYSVLKVPSGCIDAYKKATGWNDFANITGLDE